MASLHVLPLQWSVLPLLNETGPLDDDDLACLRDMRDTLARHGKLGRFGIHLAHRHFDMGPDEILIERPDPDSRTQHVTVGRLEDFPHAVPTTWMMGDSNARPENPKVACVCVSGPSGEGCIAHGRGAGRGPETFSEGVAKEDAIKQRRIQREKSGSYRGPVAGHDRDGERER